MGTKTEPGEHDCYGEALPDEPMFVLLARDPDFKDVVEYWAWKRLHRYVHSNMESGDEAQIEEAMKCAAAGDRWRKDNLGKWLKQDDD